MYLMVPRTQRFIDILYRLREEWTSADILTIVHLANKLFLSPRLVARTICSCVGESEGRDI